MPMKACNALMIFYNLLDDLSENCTEHFYMAYNDDTMIFATG